MADLKALADAVIKGDQTTAVDVTKAAVSEGVPAKQILDEGLIAGMDVVGARFKKNEIYIPEVLIAARAMKMAMEVLEPELAKAGVEPIGKLLIGTVQGDLHDIGKNLVAMMLKGAGFEVIDLGVDVAPEKFVEEAKTRGVNLIGMSALLTTTMDHQGAAGRQYRRQGDGGRGPGDPELCREGRRAGLRPGCGLGGRYRQEPRGLSRPGVKASDLDRQSRQNRRSFLCCDTQRTAHAALSSFLSSSGFCVPPPFLGALPPPPSAQHPRSLPPVNPKIPENCLLSIRRYPKTGRALFLPWDSQVRKFCDQAGGPGIRDWKIPNEPNSPSRREGAPGRGGRLLQNETAEATCECGFRLACGPRR